MDEIMTKAVSSLIAAGPLAIVLLIAIRTLWAENKALQERLLKILEGIAGMKEEKK